MGMKKLLILILALAMNPLLLWAGPGAWERFSTQSHADAWVFLDYSDDQIYQMFWEDVDDPFISIETLEDNGIWTYADEVGGQTGLLGDLSGVEAIELDAFIDDPLNMDFIDIVILAEVDGSPRFYFSPIFTGSEFPAADWYDLSVSFASEWVVLNENDEFVPAQLTDEVLSDVIEVGMRYFPLEGSTDGQYIGWDNFRLRAKLTEPATSLAVGNGSFTLNLVTEPGVEYDLERWAVGSNDWQVVPGETEIAPGVPYQFMTSMDEPLRLFRFRMFPYFEELEAPAF